MTPTQAFISAIIVAVISGPIWPVVVTKFVERKNRAETREQERLEKLEEQKERERARVQAQKEKERDEWMEESKAAYALVKAENEGFRKELDRVKREELEPLKRDQAQLREALIGRCEVIDELLPHITHLPPETVRELQRKNRSQQIAAFRGNWYT